MQTPNERREEKTAILRQSRVACVEGAIAALREAVECLNHAQARTQSLGHHTTDCADAARQIEALISSDRGQAGLEALLALYKRD